MTAVVKQLTIEAGVTFFLSFVMTHESTTAPGTAGLPYVFTDCTARMQIRAKIDTPILLEASTSNSKITLGSGGRVDVVLTDIDTETLRGIKSAVYDFKMRMADTTVKKLFKGGVTIDPDVTHDG